MSTIPDLPPSLKPVQEYLVKAKQLAKAKPVVSHYCKVYAVERGLKVRDKADKSTLSFLMPLMDELEKEKKEWPDLKNLEDPQMQVELFALEIFKKADDQYYAGKADKNTAISFRAAASIMEVCNQFGELPPDVAEKYKYAKVKTVEIMKAIKEGRTAMPPVMEEAPEVPVQGEAIQEEEEDDDDGPPPPPPPLPDDQAAAPSTSYAPGPPPPMPSVAPPAAPAAPPAVPAYANPRPAAVPAASHPPAVKHTPPPSSGPLGARSLDSLECKPRERISTDDLVNAEKYCKYALSALQFDDPKEAVTNLKKALARLSA